MSSATSRTSNIEAARFALVASSFTAAVSFTASTGSFTFVIVSVNGIETSGDAPTVEHTDWLNDHADALMTRAEVLVACGEHADAHEAMQAALALYERKGNATTAENVRAKLTRARVGVRGSAEPRR